MGAGIGLGTGVLDEGLAEDSGAGAGAGRAEDGGDDVGQGVDLGVALDFAECLDLFPPMVDEEERIWERNEVRERMQEMAENMQARITRAFLFGTDLREPFGR